MKTKMLLKLKYGDINECIFNLMCILHDNSIDFTYSGKSLHTSKHEIYPSRLSKRHMFVRLKRSPSGEYILPDILIDNILDIVRSNVDLLTLADIRV